jgi:hypothetical protein
MPFKGQGEFIRETSVPSDEETEEAGVKRHGGLRRDQRLKRGHVRTATGLTKAG